MNNVDTRGRLILNGFIRVPASQETVVKYSLLAGDVLFNNTNSTELVGKSAVFTGHAEPVVYSNHFTRLRTRVEQLDSDYLASWLLGEWQKRTFENLCNRWIGQSAVKMDKLLGLEIPLPPLAEQKRIAAILNEQMAGVERARAAVQAQVDASRALIDAHVREAFPGYGQELPRGWRLARLGEVLSAMTNGTTWDQNKHGIGLRVTRIETISKGTIDRNRTGWIDAPLESVTAYRLKSGDILFSHINSLERLGNCAMYEGDPPVLIHGMNLLRLECNMELVVPRFLLHVLRSQTAVSLYRHRARRAIGQASLNTSDVSGLPIPVCPLADQKRIAVELDQKTGAVEKLQIHLWDELAQIKALPAAALRRAFRGEA